MPRKHYVMAVDIGTTRTKGIILDNKANSIVTSSKTHVDEGLLLGEHEQNAEEVWWSEFVTSVRQMFNKTGISAHDIESVCITGMFPCFCPANQDGVPLCNALLYDDNRAFEFAKQLQSSDKSILHGNELLARLAWFRQTYPEQHHQLRRVFSTHSFVVFRLTNRYCIDGHTAYLFGNVFDPLNFSWNKNEMQQVGLDEGLLPEILPPASIAGFVNKTSAQETGLANGTPVLVGTGDIFASILGSGAHNQGDLMIHYGSTGALIELTQNVIFLLNSNSYPNDNDGIRWIVALPRSSKQLDWFSNLLNTYGNNAGTNNILRELDTKINISEPAKSQIAFIHNVQKQDLTVIPPLAGFFAIPLNATAIDLHRAILEAFSYRIRYGAETNELLHPHTPLYSAGGGIQSTEWCQITSDILGSNQRICSGAEEALGGALLAGYAVSLFDLEKVIEGRIQTAKVIRPQAHLQESYNGFYRKYLSTWQSRQSQ